jgi:ribosomal-protein-alanine N-acetyltransferase
MPTLRGERVLVRELAPGDLPAVEALVGAPREAWLRWTVLGYAQYAELLQPPYGERAIELAGAGELVGLAGLTPSLGPFGLLPAWHGDDGGFRPEVGLFYEVAPAHRRGGLASEAAALLVGYAFEALRLARVVATTTHDNDGSLGVMRRIGMRIERNPTPEPAWFQAVGVIDRPA